jgi:acetyltransferase-like isoleucine patch superfamily enzyme
MGEPLFFTSDHLKSCIDANQVVVGKHTYGNVKILHPRGNCKLHIGNFCSFAAGLTVHLHSEHYMKRVTTYPFRAISRIKNLDWGDSGIKGDALAKGDVHIGNDVWIGRASTILSGISIGDGAVVGACSLITKNVAPYSVVGGNPARFIKWRFPEDIREALLRIKWWDWSDEAIKDAMPLLCSENIDECVEHFDISGGGGGGGGFLFAVFLINFN